jgi:hypothetical protein
VTFFAPRIRVSTTIPAPPGRVWDDIRDIGSHVDWMEDALAIRFTGRSREGKGTRFVCDTRIGPFALSDSMVVTEWVAGRSMGIRHEGIISGVGRFTLAKRRRGTTRFTWTERLYFPWWLGGPLGARAARPVLRRVWKRNLRNLRDRFYA